MKSSTETELLDKDWQLMIGGLSGMYEKRNITGRGFFLSFHFRFQVGVFFQLFFVKKDAIRLT